MAPRTNLIRKIPIDVHGTYLQSILYTFSNFRRGIRTKDIFFKQAII